MQSGVGAAAVCGEVVRMESIPEESSIFTAEVYAIILAMSIVKGSKKKEFVIFSDSYSFLTKLSTCNTQTFMCEHYNMNCASRTNPKSLFLLDTQSCGFPWK